MFERCTDKARKVVFLAKGKATERDDDQIRPVHMLYGLAAADGVAARVLAALGGDAGARPGPRPVPWAPGTRRPAMTPRRSPRSASTWTRSSAGSRTASAREHS